MKASVAIQIEPNMPTRAEAIPVVDKVINYIRSTGLHYYVGPCKTAVEGESLDQLTGIVKTTFWSPKKPARPKSPPMSSSITVPQEES